MNFSWLPSPRKLLIWLITAVALLILYALRVQLWTALTPFVFAVLLALLIAPLVELLERRGVPRSLAILLIYLVVILAIVVLGIFVIPAIVSEVEGLVARLPQLFADAQELLNSLQERFDWLEFETTLTQVLLDTLQDIQQWLVAVLSGIIPLISSIFSHVITILLVPLLAFYFLKDREIIHRGLENLVPVKSRGRITALFTRIGDTLGTWIRGQMLVGLIVGFIVFVGLEIVGMDFALILGVITTLVDIIPYFGPFIAGAPAVLLALAHSPTMAFKVLLVELIAQQVESQLITPQIMSKQLDLHPLVVIFALLLGGQIGGLLGLLFAVPIAAILKVTVEFFLEGE
ncbi:MAG: AI-2E family transporter [Bacillota bacterium]|jgi:predicted PurR-regulated permease PerM